MLLEYHARGVDAADLLHAVEAMVQAMPVARVQELQWQVGKVGRPRAAKIMARALRQRQSRLVVIIGGAVGQENRQ